MCIPTFNTARHLPEAIQRVFDQEFAGHQPVVYDLVDRTTRKSNFGIVFVSCRTRRELIRRLQINSLSPLRPILPVGVPSRGPG